MMNSELPHQALVDKVITLQERGYDHDFVADQDGIVCLQCSDIIKKEEFDIVEHYCYHLQENCNKVYHLFAIQLWNSGIKGILINVHGLEEFIS